MHQAIISKIDKVEEIKGADNIQLAFVLGTPVIVSKDKKVNDIGILFPSELALSPEFAAQNNLYRDSEFNKDKSKKGFFSNNLRVVTQKFLRTPSDGLFIDFDSVEFTNYDIGSFKIGDQFTELNGVQICEKYISQKTREHMARQKNNVKKVRCVSAPMFKELGDTNQLVHYIDTIPKGALITVEHKWHGTSGRVTYTKTLTKLPKWKQLVNKLLPVFSGEKWEYLSGSRRVVLYPKDDERVGFHGPEQFRRDILESFKPYLEKGMTIFFEIVGFVNGGPIMPKHDITKLGKEYVKKYGKEVTYKYGCLPDQYKVKVYKITLTNEDNFSLDFSSAQMIDWCELRGFVAARPVIDRFIYDGDGERLLNVVKALADRDYILSEDYVDPSHINEGVVVRVDAGDLGARYLKYKGFSFKLAEGLIKESTVDTEDAS